MAQMELRPDSHGKVRDIYDTGDALLMVASDRISAFDYILPDEIPFKGEAPELPQDVIEGTSARYREAFEIITGSKFESKKEQ